MVVGRIQVRAVFAVMQMMIRTALTALLTASRTATKNTSNIVNVNDAKIENYENYLALRHSRRNRFECGQPSDGARDYAGHLWIANIV